MKRYVIWIREGEQTVYVRVDPNGSAKAVSSAFDATALPNRFAASVILEAIKPAIKKSNLSVDIGIESL